MNSAIIYAELSTNEQFLGLSDSAALLFLMSLTHCDDYGRIKASANHWALKVAPGRFTVPTIKKLQEELIAASDKAGNALLRPYEAEGEDYLLVPKWFRWQRFRHDYILNAVCPHPLARVVEPPVTSKTLRGTFGDLREADYNSLEDEIYAFIGKGKQRDKSAHSRDNSNTNARPTRDDSENSRVLDPPSSPASASTPASASASPPAPTARGKKTAGGGGGGKGGSSTTLDLSGPGTASTKGGAKADEGEGKPAAPVEGGEPKAIDVVLMPDAVLQAIINDPHQKFFHEIAQAEIDRRGEGEPNRRGRGGGGPKSIRTVVTAGGRP